jgi:beta-lactamase class A
MEMKRWFVTIALSAAIGSTITWGIQKMIQDGNEETIELSHIEFKRRSGYKFIKPLQFVESKYEYSSYINLKNQLQQTIDSLIEIGQLSAASVYLRDFDQSGWIHVNPENKFHPGSLLKMGTLYEVLLQAERDSSLLAKKLMFQPGTERIPTQSYGSRSIKPNTEYSVYELLNYMIAYSDNYATSVLHSVVNYDNYLKIFTELNIPKPNVSSAQYTLKASEISNFLKVLYNSTFLSPVMSEKAFEILMRCDFKNGMSAGLPNSVPVAHKFGEFGLPNSDHELHEMGIMYLRDKPYVLTIMTAGKKVDHLAPAIAKITQQTSKYLLKLDAQK